MDRQYFSVDNDEFIIQTLYDMDEDNEYDLNMQVYHTYSFYGLKSHSAVITDVHIVDELGNSIGNGTFETSFSILNYDIE